MPDQPETPKILAELAKGNAKAEGSRSRQQKNARRRILIALALFIPVLAGIFVVGYQQILMWEKINNISEENQQLSSVVSDKDILIADLLEQLRASPPSIGIESSGITNLQNILDTELPELQEQLLELKSQYDTLNNAPNLDWKLSESEFLVRLANQKLLLELDIGSAILLLEAADAALMQSGSNAVVAARQSVGSDLSLLRSLEIVDRQGIYIRLSNLGNYIEHINLLQSMRDKFDEKSNTESFGAQYNGSLETIVNFLSSIFIWRKWDANPAAILVSDQETSIKQSLYLMLEQAKLGVVSKDSELYEYSLANIRESLFRYALDETIIGMKIIAEIDELKGINVRPTLPNLTNSLTLIAQLTSG